MYEQILQVAESFFMQQGYHGTSTRQIADALGIKQPNIYYHFKGKEAIYFEVMVTLSEEVSVNLWRISKDPDLTLAEKIYDMFAFLKRRHPVNFYMMMNDIQHSVSKETSFKLYHLWKENYQKPIVTLFESSETKIRGGVSPEFATSQLFILLAAHLDVNQTHDQMAPAIDLFLYGLINDQPEDSR
ncbi:TetR/AcrR family transcriptional regulator [Enterococcus sp.]|uniref:TetR/AcrR family transcriptional regulator n=1 Tax=Enterococcus sp. TaxID=35783 RepID=UPI002897D766|nr:TetR/AcrR family transcriptional regulator [Enterococcus sp.]